MSSMTAEQIAALVAQTVAAAMAANDEPTEDRATAKVKADGPTLRTQSAKRETAAKVATLHRKLDTIVVAAGDSVRFVVTPCFGSDGGLRHASAVEMFETDSKGKEQKRRSMTAGIVNAMAEDVGILEQLVAAIDEVDKAAKLGKYAPKKVAATA